MKRFDYFKPQSLDEAWKLKQKFSSAKFIAGGTDLMVSIKNNDLLPPALISLRSIPELAGIEINNGARMGATATISDILHHPGLKNSYSILGEAAQSMGSVQIRNVATIGGNLCNCSPCADMATALLVLEAKVRLQTLQSSREVSINEFFLGPGTSCQNPDEIMTDILLEPPQNNTQALFLKKGRVKMDLAIASIALLLHMEGKKCLQARLAAGSVAPVPLRLFNVEELLEGSVITRDLIAQAQKLARKSVTPISDVRSSAEYRRQIIGVYVRRGLEQILAGSQT